MCSVTGWPRKCLVVGGIAHLGILCKLAGGDVVYGVHDLDVVLLRLLHQRINLLRSWLIEKGSTDLSCGLSIHRSADRFISGQKTTYLDTLEDFLEGESHTAGDDQRVHFVE